MATTDPLSAQLLIRWREGDQAAADALFRRYAERLIGLVRLRLSEKLARRVDPEDIVQSVYRSFFLAPAPVGTPWTRAVTCGGF